MHGPNGGDYPNDSVFGFTLTVTLAAEGAGTRVAWRQAFESASELESVRRFAGSANEENLDRLEREVAGAPPDARAT